MRMCLRIDLSQSADPAGSKCEWQLGPAKDGRELAWWAAKFANLVGADRVSVFNLKPDA